MKRGVLLPRKSRLATWPLTQAAVIHHRERAAALTPGRSPAMLRDSPHPSQAHEKSPADLVTDEAW